MDAKFRNFLEKSNFLISSLVIRSLIYDNSKNKLTFDKIRLRDELFFYKYVVKTQKPSIISALYPIIYGNKNIYTGYEEAINLFKFIRKDLNSVEQYAIFLLSKIIKNSDIQKEDIIEFNIENIAKEQAINLQKAKVESIIKFDNILELVFIYLKEDIIYKNIFQSDSMIENDKYKDTLSKYYENLHLGNITAKKYVSNNIEVIDSLFSLNEQDKLSCSLIPIGFISKKIVNEKGILIVLETPNTIYTLTK